MKKEEFIPKPDQIDYSKARWAPVINCVLKYKDKLLVVKRSDDLNFYPGYWNGISGFLDDKKTLQEKVAEEISEELGMQDEVKLDWEANKYQWLKIDDVRKLDLLPGFDQVLERLDKWIK